MKYFNEKLIPQRLVLEKDNKSMLMFMAIPKTGTKFVDSTFLRENCPIDYWGLHHCYSIEDANDINTCIYQGFGMYGNAIEKVKNTVSEEKFKKFMNLLKQDKIICFTSVRNPFAMLYSIFKDNWSKHPPSINSMFYSGMLGKNTGNINESIISLSYGEKIDDFNDFIDFWFNNDLASSFIPYFGKFLLFQLFDNHGECKFPYAVRSERMSESLEILYNLLGYNAPEHVFRSLGPEKENGGKISEPDEYKSAYNEKSIDIINKHCKRELDVLGYNFDGPKDDRVILDLSNVFYNPKSDKFYIKNIPQNYLNVKNTNGVKT